MKRINETKVDSLKKLKIEKCLVRFFKKKKKGTSQINNKRDENVDITSDSVKNK